MCRPRSELGRRHHFARRRRRGLSFPSRERAHVHRECRLRRCRVGVIGDERYLRSPLLVQHERPIVPLAGKERRRRTGRELTHECTGFRGIRRRGRIRQPFFGVVHRVRRDIFDLCLGSSGELAQHERKARIAARAPAPAGGRRSPRRQLPPTSTATTTARPPPWPPPPPAGGAPSDSSMYAMYFAPSRARRNDRTRGNDRHAAVGQRDDAEVVSRLGGRTAPAPAARHGVVLRLRRVLEKGDKTGVTRELSGRSRKSRVRVRLHLRPPGKAARAPLNSAPPDVARTVTSPSPTMGPAVYAVHLPSGDSAGPVSARQVSYVSCAIGLFVP